MDPERRDSLDGNIDNVDEDIEVSEEEENLSNKEVCRRFDVKLKRSQRTVTQKVEDVERRVNDLYRRTLEAIMKLYKSNDQRSGNKPWESFREAADHLSEIHKLMKNELTDLYRVSQRRGSLTYSSRLFSTFRPCAGPSRPSHILPRALFESQLWPTSPSASMTTKRSVSSSTLGTVALAGDGEFVSSSDDEDERLENELKRRRTDHDWR